MGSTNTNTTATPNTVTTNNQVPLSAVAHFERTTAPLAIAHQEQFPAVTISFDLAPGYALSDALTAISKAEQHDRHAGERQRQLLRRRRRIRQLACAASPG